MLMLQTTHAKYLKYFLMFYFSNRILVLFKTKVYVNYFSSPLLYHQNIKSLLIDIICRINIYNIRSLSFLINHFRKVRSGEKTDVLVNIL